jgi:transcriptional regulator with XRE-family HTH domain
MPSGTALGQYLRARRELVRPEDVNLRTAGRRRVPGLRREELAMLAGISPDYYLRLEQGRDHHPSAHVLNALARALQLDEHATAHLHSLSQPTVARRRTGESERAPESVTRLIASWSNTPAFVQGRHMDVLAANALASAVSPVFSPGVNIVQATFLDPEVRRLVGDDWDTITHNAVARLRALAGSDVDDPRLGELVGELSARSVPTSGAKPLPHQPLAQITGHHGEANDAQPPRRAPTRATGHDGGQRRLGDQRGHRGRQGGPPEQGVAGDRIRLSMHPEHVVGMHPPQRHHHPGDARAE